jgi:uncharacterized protein (UPF0262 family)
VTLHAVRIDEPLWSGASAVRRAEWTTLITDLLRAESPWPTRAGATVIIGCDDELIVFRFTQDDAEDVTSVPRGDLRALFDEYLGVIDRLGEDDLHPMRMEALDMAKRVVHDGGARRLGELLPDLAESLDARRRLFSLVVSLVVDTTRRPWAHRHA